MLKIHIEYKQNMILGGQSIQAILTQVLISSKPYLEEFIILSKIMESMYQIMNTTTRHLAVCCIIPTGKKTLGNT